MKVLLAGLALVVGLSLFVLLMIGIIGYVVTHP